jgi:hypothetical protein
MIASLLLTAAAAAGAQDLTICADRPGKASQTCIVPPGHVQVEIGVADWTLTKNEGERDTTLTIGQFAIKYGLTERSHIEVDVTPWQRVTSQIASQRDRASGFGDLLLVYKHLLTAADAPLQVAASPFVKVPTAKRPIGNRKWEGGLVVPIQYAIPKSPLTVALTPELDWVADGDGRGRHALAASVVNLGWQATRTLNLSAEVWGQWDWDPSGTERQVSADVAASYLASSRVQLDVGANFGLNRATPDSDLYLGASFLF